MAVVLFSSEILRPTYLSHKLQVLCFDRYLAQPAGQCHIDNNGLNYCSDLSISTSFVIMAKVLTELAPMR